MFVQIHVTRDHFFALPNRDQSGNAKRGYYGNAERQRISSQCLKAALRSSSSNMVRFDAVTGDYVSDTLEVLAKSLDTGLSVRSRVILPVLIGPRLLDAFPDFSEAEVAAYLTAAGCLFRKGAAEAPETGEPADADELAAEPEVPTTAASKKEAKAKAKADNAAKDAGAIEVAGKLSQPIVMGPREIDALGGALIDIVRAGLPATALVQYANAKKSKEFTANPAVSAVTEIMKPLHEVMNNQAGLDGSLFGRFSTSALTDSVTACVAVAHQMTVHPLQSTGDYFTVQDTLAEGQGFSHANSTELTSGLFYGYVVIDIRQMQKNIAANSPEDIGRIVAWIIRALHQVEPAAKRGSTAGYASVHEMLVEIGSRQPRSLASAYQNAIQPEALGSVSISEKAISRLHATAEQLSRSGGRPRHQLWLTETSANIDGREEAGYEILAKNAGDIVRDALLAAA